MSNSNKKKNNANKSANNSSKKTNTNKPAKNASGNTNTNKPATNTSGNTNINKPVINVSENENIDNTTTKEIEIENVTGNINETVDDASKDSGNSKTQAEKSNKSYKLELKYDSKKQDNKGGKSKVNVSVNGKSVGKSKKPQSTTAEKKTYPLVSPRFVLTCDTYLEASFESPWTIKRHMTKRDVKAGKKINTEEVLGTITISKPDLYEVVDVTYEFNKKLYIDEYVEIFKTIFEAASRISNVSHFRVCTTDIPEDIEETLWQLDFKGDPLDRDYLIKPADVVSWTLVLMYGGMLFGLIIGVAIDRLGIGYGYGVLFGILIGTLVDRSGRKQQKALWEGRIKNASMNRTDSKSEYI